MNEILKTMASHRSIRKYTNQPIADDLLNEILTTSRQASTSSNLQAYAIIVVKDQTKKEKLAELCINQPWIAKCPVYLVICPDLYRLEKVAARQGYQSNDRYIELFIVATVDAALVAQNILTAAESCGLGGVMTGSIRNNPAEVAAMLELPDKVYPLMGICLGYPDYDPMIKPRLMSEAIIHHERYDDSGLDDQLTGYDKLIKATGLYDGPRRKVQSPTGKEVPDDIYSWCEHTSRRLAATNPSTTRTHLKQFLLDKKFGLE
jgi:nitroreductase